MLRGILVFALGALLVVGGIVAYQFFAPSTASQASSGTTNPDARSAFLTERGGGVITDTTGTGGGAGGFAGGAPGLFGTVETVTADGLTVKSQTDGATTTVHLASGAAVNKQATGQNSDIKVGDQVTASGAQNGDSFAATVIQVGGTGFGAGFGRQGAANASGTPFAGRPSANGTPVAGQRGANADGTPFTRAQGTPGAGFGGAGGAGFAGVRGTVTAVGGTSVTVQTQDGSTAVVQLATDGRILIWHAVALSEVQVGETVIATGALNGAVFEATTVQVTEMQMMTRQ